MELIPQLSPGMSTSHIPAIRWTQVGVWPDHDEVKPLWIGASTNSGNFTALAVLICFPLDTHLLTTSAGALCRHWEIGLRPWRLSRKTFIVTITVLHENSKRYEDTFEFSI